MSQIYMQFSSALVGALVVMMVLAHAQDQSADFISIDCGLQQNSDYTQSTTTIRYTPDTDYIDTGESKAVVRDEYNSEQQIWFVRVFLEGTRNCYKINIKSGQKYLLRAGFMYGNYDREKNLPEFEIHLGATLWDSVVFTKDEIIIKELIHVPKRDYIHVCLINTNKGVPFISTIELRRLRNDAYQTEVGSLALMKRINMAVNETVYRYPDDVNDRIWRHEDFSNDWKQLIAPDLIAPNQTDYELPSVVMSTAATPSFSQYMNFSWAPGVVDDKNASYYIYMHFAEVEKVITGRSRKLTVTINGEVIDEPFVPVYLNTTIKDTKVAADIGEYHFSIYSPEQAYRSILNAYEIYMKKDFLVSETNQQDVEAITNLKSTYKIIKNWQGDPCNPQVYLWEGVKCNYSDNDSARIISLDLSSSGLTGEITDSIANLTMIENLDLSNNKLSGQIPQYLSQLSKLKTLNLEKNELTGSVPAGLNAKRNVGLSLRLCGNQNLTGEVPCQKKKNQFVIPVVISIVVLLLVSSIAAAILGNSQRFRDARKYRRLAKLNRKGPCDVFLSFRGEDTRKGFTHNLYVALREKEIKTFIDDEKLEKGAKIGPTLLDAIEAAKVSVVVLSKNYTSSSWCLNELVKIIECRKKDQDTYPVFYEVEPTEVRDQIGTYTLDNKHSKHTAKNISEWKKALTEVANLAGLTYANCKNEREAIEAIVKDVSEKINKQNSKRSKKVETPPQSV